MKLVFSCYTLAMIHIHLNAPHGYTPNVGQAHANFVQFGELCGSFFTN